MPIPPIAAKPDPAERPWWVWLVFVLLVHSLFLQEVGYDNVMSRLALTFSLAEQGSFQIDRFAHLSTDVSKYAGHFYTDKAPGLSVLMVPLFWGWKGLSGLLAPVWGAQLGLLGFRWLAQLLLLGVPTGLVAAVLWRWSGEHTHDERLRVLLVTGYVLGTPALPYGTSLYGHQFAAACAFLGWWLLRRAAGCAAWWEGLLGGVVLGSAWFGDYPAIVLSLLLGAASLLAYPGLRARAWQPVLGGAVPVALMAAYNWACFGNPLTLSYAHKYNPAFAEVHGTGLYGLALPRWDATWTMFLSLHKGLFYLSPWLMFAVVGGVVGVLRRPKLRAELGLFWAAVVGYSLLFSTFVDFEAGYTWGPRHLVPMLPFLAGLAVGLDLRRIEQTRAFGPFSVGALLVASWLTSQAVMVIGTLTCIHVPLQIAFPLRDFFPPLVQAGYTSSSLGVLLGWPRHLTTFLSAMLILIAYLIALPRRSAFFAGRLWEDGLRTGIVWAVVWLGVPWLVLPVSPWSALGVGQALLDVGKPAAAVTYLGAAVEGSVGREQALAGLARAQADLGEHGLAAQAWMGLYREGGSLEVLEQALAAALDGGDVNLCLALAGEAAETPVSYLYRGFLAQRRGDWATAERLLLDPKLATVPAEVRGRVAKQVEGR